jgi:signal transduction histidine kinase
MTKNRQVARESDVTLPRRDEAGWARYRRLERQLHDGPALRLAAVSLRLGLCQHRAAADDEMLQQCLAGIQDELHAVVQELRDLAGEIYPPLLETAGLVPALAAFAERHGVPMRVPASGERQDASAEATAYFAVAERLLSLTGRCSSATLAVHRSGDELVVTLTSDVGGPANGGSDQECARDVLTVRVPCTP